MFNPLSLRLWSTQSKKNQQTGSAMAEFAISLPVMLMIMFGVMEIGTQNAEFFWVSQSSYQAALKGAEFPSSVALNKMTERYTRLQQLQGSARLDSEPEATPGVGDRSVTFSSSNNLRPISGESSTSSFLGLPRQLSVGDSYVAPHLLKNDGNVIPDLREFGNPSGRFYNCNWERVGATVSTCFAGGKSNDDGPSMDGGDTGSPINPRI